MARIGIDYTAAVQQAAGIGRYVRELFRALLTLDTTHQYRLFAASPRPIPASAQLPVRITRLPFHDKWLMRVWHRAQLPLPVELITGRVDLFHSPDFTLPPTLPGTRTILTVHDLSFVRDPDSANERLRAYLNDTVPRSVRRAHHILADSQSTKADLIDLWGTPADKITVIYCGVDARFRPATDPAKLQVVRRRYGIGAGPFVLSLGTIHPRKNYRRLIEAFVPLAARYTDLSLVIGGGRGWQFQEILAEPSRRSISDRVRFAGFIADDDLPALYSAAALVAMPSLYEGFGIPLLEAMACGTPVVASTHSSLPEVIGDAGLQVDPLSVEALTVAMERLFTDAALRTELVGRGFQRASQFTWDKAARRLLDVYRRHLSEQ